MTVASVPGRDDFRPESQGIFRLFRNDPAPAPDSPSVQAEAPLDAAVPLPRRRPASAGRVSEDKVALAAPGL